MVGFKKNVFFMNFTHVFYHWNGISNIWKLKKKVGANRLDSNAPVEAINYIDAEKFNAVIINVLISSAKPGHVSWWLTVLLFFRLSILSLYPSIMVAIQAPFRNVCV